MTLALLGALLSAPPPPITGVVRLPPGVRGPILLVARDSARGITRAEWHRGGTFELPSSAGSRVELVAETPDGEWLARAEASERTELTLTRAGGAGRRPSSARWLAAMPNDETRRRFILDCTGCHQFDESRARYQGPPRTAARWREDLDRMLQYAGPRSSFPVISDWPEGSAHQWLAGAVASGQPAPPTDVVDPLYQAVVTEYEVPEAGDLPHDVAVDSGPTGRVIVTGMFSHALFSLDPATGVFERIGIPVPKANPRAIEIDAEGNWWILLGGPRVVARYRPVDRQWTTTEIGAYPHSIALDGRGRAWFNDHFGRDPERIGFVDVATGAVRHFELPLNQRFAAGPGGPVPYELRAGPDGRIWLSELQGNRLIVFDPSTGMATAHSLPTSWSGPRRFDVDRQGIVWVPGYASNTLIRFDPARSTFEEFPLPEPGATPYVVRADPATGHLWIATSASDQVYRFDPATRRFATVPLPSRGAIVRHMAVDSRRGEIWLAYGASPGRLSARVARIQLPR